MPAQLLAGTFGTRPTLAPCCGQRRHTHRRSNSPKNVRDGTSVHLCNPAHCLRGKIVSSARRVAQTHRCAISDIFGSSGCWRALPACRASRSRDHSRRSTRAKKPRQRTALQRNHQSAGSSGAANQLCGVPDMLLGGGHRYRKGQHAGQRCSTDRNRDDELALRSHFKISRREN